MWWYMLVLVVSYVVLFIGLCFGGSWGNNWDFLVLGFLLGDVLLGEYDLGDV